jgi:hypothetical protein
MRASLRIVVPALVSLGLFACGSSDPLKSEGLASSSVTEAKLANNSVTNPKLADGAVDARTLGAGAVTSAGLAAGAVTSAAIADGAVTSSALASGAVTPSALADDSVSSAAIANGSVGTSELAAKAVTTGTINDKAVTTSKLNDGAVTTAKIATGAVTASSLAPNAAVLGLNGLTGGVTVAGGQNISVSKSGNTISVGLSGTVNANLLEGNDAATFARRDTHVITVAKQGGDFSTIGSALASITTASASNPYLVRVGPGEYVESVTMKPFVDVEGSGTGITTIRATAADGPEKGTVIGASNSQLRNVTVKSLGPGAGYATAIAAQAGNTFSLLNVQAVAQSAGAFNGDGVYARGAGALVEAKNLTIVSSGASLNNYGVYAEVSAQVICRECTVTVPAVAGSYALYNAGGAPVYAANSQVIGSTQAAVCAGAYDQAFAPRSCP